MTATSIRGLLRHLHKIADPSGAAGVGDAELVERFVQRRDEAAFELLVWRHQRMVLGVCRRILGNLHDAEDAFQAAFLALARKAAAVGRRQSVAAWLHTVAYRVALRARASRRLKTNIDLDSVTSSGDTAVEAARRDLAAVLDEEIGRLPEKYRVAVVLCYLEGKSYAEASRQLGLAVGTLSGHLTRARALLHKRLTRRGIGVTGAVLAAVLSEQASSANTPAALVKTATAMITGQSASSVSSTIAALTDGALRSMFLSKMKMVAIVLFGGLLVAGIGSLIPAVLSVPPAVPAESPAPSAKPADNEKTVRVDRFGDPLPPGALFRFGSVRMRHDSTIRASALSPDGKILATSSGRSVVLWDLPTSKPLRRFIVENWPYSFPGIAFSPDGKHLGYIHSADFACVWDVSSGEEVLRLAGEKYNHHRVCQFTSAGKELILSEAKRLNFWDWRTKKETHSIRIERVDLLSPDARTWVRIRPETIQFGDVKLGEEIVGLLSRSSKYDGFENGIAFAPDGKTLAVVHQQKEIQVFDFPISEMRTSFPLPDSAKHSVSKQDYWGYRVSFSTDGRTLLLGTKEGIVHRWDLAASKELPALKKHWDAAIGVHTLPDKRTIITTGADGLIRRWDSQTGRELSKPEGYVGRLHAAYSPRGRFAAIGDASGRLDLWDFRNVRAPRVLQREGPAVTKLTFAPDGKSLAAALADNTVHLWNIPSGEEKHVLRNAKEQDLSYVHNMLFSPDGRRLLIADRNFHARLWDLDTDAVCWRGRFDSAAFSSDGKTIVTAFGGPYLHVLDAANGKPRAKLRLNSNAPDNFGIVVALAASPDGRVLAVALHGGDVYLCDAKTGAELKRFQAVDPPKGMHAKMLRDRVSRVDGLAFSPDGKRLCTSGSDGSVRIWEVVTGREVLRLKGHEGQSSEVSFGADSRTVLSCGEDGQAYLWSLIPE